MKLSEALRIVQTPAPEGAQSFTLALAFSHTALHLGTFLAAHLRQALPCRAVAIASGLYDDLAGSLARFSSSTADAIAVVLEWNDFDPRLGLRSLGSWAPDRLGELLEEAQRRASRLEELIRSAAQTAPVAVSLPTLPLPPLDHTSTAQSGVFQCRLQALAADLALRLAQIPRVQVLSSGALDRESPAPARHDVRAELDAGFPYQLPHADALARALARLIAPPPPKKGVITDLDDTLWRGIVGEESAQGVHWDLEHHAQPHGLYQRLLDSLSRSGTLVAVASKNDPEVALEALRRPDILIPAGRFFPIECHWRPKSESVARILDAWNIAADAAVFIDDNPLELEEVQRAHPGIECRLFPRSSPEGVWKLCHDLRDLCGRPVLSPEDELRAASLRQSADWRRAASGGSAEEDLLAGVNGTVVFSWLKDPSDPRPLELINKTNQFNLNGRRWTEGDWLAWLRDPLSRLLVVSYRDKFGPLGKIAVAALRAVGGALTVESWVMSCRAFSRRIEHHTLKEILDATSAASLRLNYSPTSRNSPLREFLSGFAELPDSEGTVTIEARRFRELCPPLYHARESDPPPAGPEHPKGKTTAPVV
ncbi:MAG: HAD-IIIC family phosphatase [Bryobacteraceae bacterium]|nr:HAD-IIIC family phosphatase [Bryobacteraceae bacterium]